MNCNNCTNNNALKEVKIKHVHGNVLRMAIPLTLRTIELVDGEINATDSPFVPSSEHPVKVVFSKGSVSVALDATMKDGNIAYVEEKGKIPVGTYAITVTCNDDNGNPYRFKQNAVLYVADATIEAGIEETIEYEVMTWYLDAAIFLALKGEDGVGIDDIETQSSGEIGGVNTVTFILTDGRTRSFNILNGSGAVDSDLDINSPSPIANSAVTAKFNELSGELADLFGDVDYDTSSKTIRFWDKGKTNVLASLDARPFIKDGMVSNAYISNNTLVITFNTDSGKEAIGVPLTTVFNPNNYYTKTQVDSRIASAVANINLTNYYTKSQTDTMVSRITPYEVTFTTGNNSNIVCDHTIANIYQNYTNHKPIIAKYGESVGTLVYIKGGENPEAAFLFGDRFDSPYLLRNGVSGWGKEELGADIEVEPWPSIESDKPVASDGVAAALAQKVSSVTINGTTKTPDEDGDVSFTVEGGSGGYEPPVGGIPKTDLASDVQASLDKADTALQSQVQSDWNENDTSDPSYIANKPTIPEAQVNSDWNASSGVAQILNKPTIPTVPTNVSAFTNDAGYLTQHQDISGKANIADLATVATSGSYNDLSDKPVIPPAADLTGYATETYVDTTVANLVDSAPQTLDTLKELADALGDDPNFAATIATQLGNKVDKESGKSLMTDAERTKLQGIAAGAEVNVQSDWTQTTTTADDYIKNKPTLATVATSGSYNDLQDKPTIPTAQVQSDWNATSGMGVILNKPTIPTVDATLGTSSQSNAVQGGAIVEALAGKENTLTWDSAPTSSSTNPVTSGGVYTALQSKQDTIIDLSTIRTNSGKGVADISSQEDGTVDIELANGDTYTLDLNHNHTQYLTIEDIDDYVTAGTNVTITKDSQTGVLEISASGGSSGVTGITMNGSDVTISSGVAQLGTVLTSQTKANWTETNSSSDAYIQNKPNLATVATSGAYSDLSGTPTIPTVPTNVSSFTNDAGYTTNTGTITGITMNNVSKGTSGVVDLGTVITSHQDISGKANASDVYSKTQADTLLAGKQNTLTFDNAPTASSTNPVTSGGVKTYVDGKATITGITTSQDGTFTIAQSDGNSYTVNLNHVHPQYLKYELLADEAAYTALSTKDSSTLYLIPETSE